MNKMQAEDVSLEMSDWLNIKHISFDIWNTLIKGNQTYKQLRIDYFFENCNPQKFSKEAIAQVISSVDQEGDMISDITGFGFHSEQLYAKVLLQLGFEQGDIGEELGIMYKNLTTYIIDNPPVFYDKHTKNVLNHLQQSGYTLSVLSNTGFIQGNTLSNIIDRLGIGKYLSFRLFSDQIGVSKPNPVAFDRIYEDAKQLHPGLRKQQIIHIGDNHIADFNGATQYGLNGLIINTNHITIRDLPTILQTGKIL